MGSGKTHRILLRCQEKHNRSVEDASTRQLTLTACLGGLEGGGRHGLKPMLTTTEHEIGDDAEAAL
jgi:hypothetical protein